MKHPRDAYAEAEANWISQPSYLAKRFKLEDYLTEQDTDSLTQTSAYLLYEISRLQEKLRNMKSIRTIMEEVLEDKGITVI